MKPVATKTTKVLLFVGLCIFLIPSLVTELYRDWDAQGYVSHSAITHVELDRNWFPGEYRDCWQYRWTGPNNPGIRLQCVIDSQLTNTNHALSVKYHGRIDRACDKVVPRWNCRRRDWTLECWAVE
jgi:hypothetical protein